MLRTRLRENNFLPDHGGQRRRWLPAMLIAALVGSLLSPSFSDLLGPGTEGVQAAAPSQRWGSAADQEPEALGKGNTAAPASLQSQYPPVQPQDPAAKPNTTRVLDGGARAVRGFDAVSSREQPERRSRHERTYQNTDGTETTEFAQEPVNYRLPDGSWQPVDPTLVPRDSGGGWHNRADQVGVSIGEKATDHDVARMNLGDEVSLGFGVAEASPVPGAVSGSTVVYKGIRPDSDLSLEVRPGLVKENLVLHSAKAPRSWLFPLSPQGLTASIVDGQIVLRDNAGKVRARIPSGFMVDSSPVNENTGEPATSYGVTYRLEQHAGRPALRMDLDANWLNAPGRVYPVTVDPPVDMRDAATSMYVQRNSNGQNFSRVDGDLKAGHSRDSGGTYTAASYISFPGVENTLRNHKIFGAQLALTNYHSWSCNARPLTVHPVLVPWEANNQQTFPGPAYGDAIASPAFAHGFIPSGTTKSPCPTATEAVGLGDAGRDLVQRWVTGQQANNGLSVRASETDVFGWKKFTGAGTANPPRLAVTHTPYDASYKFVQPVPNPPITRTQGGKVKLEVTNLGAETWEPGRYALAYRQFTANGEFRGWLESSSLPHDVPRGSSVTLDAYIDKTPPGEYRYEFTMIKRGMAFFTDEQIPPAALALRVIDVPPAVVAQYPPNGHSAPSLTPSLWAQGVDVDAPPNTMLLFRFEVCDKDEKNCFDSGRQPSPTWTVPFGRLQWSLNYKWRVFAFDGTSESPQVPFSNLLTAVPQPEITANLGNSPYAGNTGDFNPQVGNYTTSAVEASVGAVGPELNVVRTYNSQDPRTSNAFGTGWSSRYDMRVTPDGDGSGNVVVTYPDGQQVRYGANLDATGKPTGGRLISPPGRYATMAPIPGGGWTLLDKNAALHVFRADGTLTDVYDNAKRSIFLTYGADGKLATATNRESQRKLTFTWSGSHVKTVSTDPVNGAALTWTYTYDGDRLTSVCDPNSGCTRYTYTPGSHYRNAVLDSKPDSYWRFGEREGTTAASEVTINLGTDKATYRDVTVGVPGALGVTDNSAAQFNGQSSMAVLPSGLVKKTRELTVEMWFKTTKDGALFGAQATPFEQNDSGGMPMLYVGTDGKLRGQFWNSTIDPITTQNLVNDDQWHHVVLSGSLTTQTLYLDGQTVGTRQGTIDHSRFHYSQIGMAQTGGPSAWPMVPIRGSHSKFAGVIDEVAVYQHPIGTPAVQAHFRARQGSDQVSSVKLPSGRATAQAKYDTSNGRLREYVDRNGGTWKIEAPTVSGTSGNIIRTVRVADPANRAHYYDYDPVRARILRYSAPLGMTTRPEDLPPVPTTPPTPPTCTTPEPGGPIFCDVPTGGGPGSFPPVDLQGARTYLYDEKGFQSTIVDENGHSVEMVHDERGNIRSRKTCRTVSPDCQTAYFEYYATDNLTDPRLDKVVASRDPRSATATDPAYATSYTYTSRGELETQTTADGAVVRHTYNEDREPAFDGGSAPNGLVKASTDPCGATTRYRYFRSGDLAEVTSPTGLITRYTYDTLGRKTSTTQISDAYPAGVTTTVEYDKLSRPTVITAPPTTNTVTGVKHTLRTVTAYDPDGRAERAEASDTTGGDPARVSTVAYDDRGRASRITDAEGHETSFGYDVFGNRVWTVNAAGVKYEYAYTARNKLSEIRLRGWNGDPGQPEPGPKDHLVVQSFAYDLAGQLTRQTDAMGRTTRFSYYADGLLRETIAAGFHNPDGTTRDIVLSSNTYNAAGHLTRQTTAGGHTSAFEYDAVGRIIASTDDPGGLTRRQGFQYDRNGNVTQVTRTGNESNTGTSNDASAEIVDYGYDNAGRQTTQTVHLGLDRLVTSRTYDQRGLVTAVTDPRGTADGADPAAYTSNITYDELGRPTAATAPPALVEQNGGAPELKRAESSTGYNAFNQPTDSRGPDGRTSRTNYDKLGRPIERVLPDYTPPGATQPIKATTRTEYDAIGNVLTATDPKGAVTRFAYDQMNRVVTRTDPHPDTPGQSGGTWQYSYTRVGEVLSVTDPSGARSESTYDDLGRPVTATTFERKPTPVTLTSKLAYDDAGNVTATTSPGGATSKFAYDKVGALITATSPADVKTQYGYDLAGRQVKTTDGKGRASRTIYDYAGRPSKINTHAPDGALISQSRLGYDRAGNLTSTTNPLQHTSKYTVDALGRTVEQTEPVSATESIKTSFGYDITGARTRFTDGRGNSTHYTTNAWGLTESVIEPATPAHTQTAERTWTVAYDNAANPVTMTAPGGVRRDRTFDLLGRMTKETAANTTERVAGYNELSQLTRVSAPGGDNTFTYNDRGSLLSTAGPSGTSSFGYDADNNLTTRADAAGTSTYGYLKSRLNTITDAASNTTQTLGYDESGAISTVNYGSGRTRAFTYDNVGRLKTDTVGTAASMTYDYDLAGQLTSKTTQGTAGAGQNTYGYDHQGRLTSWTGNGKTTAYGWDAAGNRTRAGDKTATYDERNRLQTDGTSSYTYSPRGTRTTKTTGTTTEAFTFDSFDRLISQGGVKYTYDGLDRVVTRGGTSVQYSGGGNDLASDGISKFSRGPFNELVALSSGTDKRIAVSDRHGDLIGGFDPTGGMDKLTDSVTFDPFGQPVATSGAKRAIGYQGDYTDPDTGQVNMTARWYDPSSGGFTSRDSISLPTTPSTGTNRYTYAFGAPTNYSDPTGHFPYNPCACPYSPPSWSLNDALNYFFQWAFNFLQSSGSGSGNGPGINPGNGPSPGSGNGPGSGGGGGGGGGGGNGGCKGKCSPPKNTPKQQPKPDPSKAARESARDAARHNPTPIPPALSQPHYGNGSKPPTSSAPDIPSKNTNDYRAPVEDVNLSYQHLQNSLLVDNNTLLGQVKSSASAPSEGSSTFRDVQTKWCDGCNDGQGWPTENGYYPSKLGPDGRPTVDVSRLTPHDYANGAWNDLFDPEGRPRAGVESLLETVPGYVPTGCDDAICGWVRGIFAFAGCEFITVGLGTLGCVALGGAVQEATNSQFTGENSLLAAARGAVLGYAFGLATEALASWATARGLVGTSEAVKDSYLLGLGGGLSSEAERLGLKHFMNLPLSKATAAFEAAINNGSKFTFNLDGMLPRGVDIRKHLDLTIESGKAGPMYGNTTNWELFKLHEAGKLGEVTFRYNGKEIPNPFKN
ncbi:LamG-like jellyroll fold domain-containing protein [Amycolatopsis japonica]|uniref:LamG-like jellyroll fold domain-containing protein n=1 Tax=Amycolatopsis japonica TaxID=208439 RepID=UPI003672E036